MGEESFSSVTHTESSKICRVTMSTRHEGGGRSGVDHSKEIGQIHLDNDFVPSSPSSSHPTQKTSVVTVE